MEGKHMRIAGIACLVVCAICVFVAVERYQANAANVRAMNTLRPAAPFGGMTINVPMRPGTPATTKYAVFFALITGIGGVVLLAKSRESPPPQTPPTTGSERPQS